MASPRKRADSDPADRGPGPCPGGGTRLTGPDGPAGAAGVSGWETISSTQTDSADRTISLACTGLLGKVIGGGYTFSAGGSEGKIAVVQNYPASATSWTVQAIETSNVATDWTLTAYVVCAIAV